VGAPDEIVVCKIRRCTLAVDQQSGRADIADDHGQATLAFPSSTASATIQVSDGTHTASITLLGQYMAGQIHIAGGDGAGGTLITDPPLTAMTDPGTTGLVAAHHI
jgi:hypothetical protein